MTDPLHRKVVVIGGGTGGLTVAARLARVFPAREIAIVEPSSKHYYQPLWTLVGAGVVAKEETEREEADFIPRGATWIREHAEKFIPEENLLVTREGTRIQYDLLLVAPGIQLDWDKVKGLKENLGSHGICSNYSYEHVEYTWESIRNFRGGNAIFTHPDTPVKCGGAPQKIMYLAEQAFRRTGVRDQSRVIFASANASIFSVEKYAKALERIVDERKIETRFRHDLKEVVPEEKKAVFQHLDSAEQVVLPYEMLHVVPPMSAPDFIKASPLADANGWVNVDPYTLQHRKHPNIFGIGDVTNLPTSKTGAAIRKQAPVVVQNALSHLAGKPLNAKYNGYTSCPLVTGYGKLILAEFNYDNIPEETFPLNQGKERYSMYLMKKHFLPRMYWRGMLRGRM